VTGRTPRVLIALALVMLSGGCAVGHFIAGVPASDPKAHESRTEATGATAVNASDLLVRRCSGCHATPEPARMSAAEWRAAVGRMKTVMTLPDHEWAAFEAMAVDAQR
jgi:hypothetical protein